jgi:2-dehydropantoate 2-reductase
MKIGIAGTGAVGGYFGARLKKEGNEVVFLARGKSLERMREKGLTIKSEMENFTVNEFFSDSYESFSDVDLVLFCVKATSTTEVAGNLKPFLKETCMIMTLQNGVDNEEILAAIFGKQRILSAAAYIQANVVEPGVVKQIGVPPKLVIGGFDSSSTEKITEIVALFNAAAIETYPSGNIIRMKWKKLMWNVTFNPLSALIGVKVGAVFDDEGLRLTAIKICQEAIAVAKAAGVDVDEDFYKTVMAQGQFAREHQTSMLQDKLSGKAIELESICGYIIKKGKELNVGTPVLETIYHLLSYQSKY